MAFKRFRVRVDGVDHEVEVEITTETETFDVRVDGRRHRVVAAPDRAWRVELPGDAPTHRTVFLSPPGPVRSAASSGVVAQIEVQTAQQAAIAEALAVQRGDPGGPATVRSPMPGRIVRVLVEEGESVTRGQPLVIVEAMKMENEVHAPSDGVVERVAAAEGETVESGQLLLELGPHPASAAESTSTGAG